jgi:23S rRNA (uracil1939-C5)-methyltransferase
LIPGGEAIATREDGKKVLLWNALPGETVTYRIIREQSRLVHAIVDEILTPSPYRISPRDAAFLATSPWQIMDYDHELGQKSLLVAEIFRQQGIALDPPAVQTDQHDFHYRNKMEYALYWDHDTAQIYPAFHARGTHHKVPVITSSLERPEIFAAATEIIADLNARHEPARKYQSLLLRCDQQGRISGGLYPNGQPHPDFPPLTDTLLGRAYTYSPNGFFQINLPVYELALREIARHIQTADVLDLYAGVGTIGLSVARDRNLTLVETHGAAFAELQNNAQSASQTKSAPAAKAVLAKSEEVLDFIAPDQTVILDPPRAGCDSQLIDHLAQIQPQTIIYLSCNPITQARDLQPLLANGYTLDRAIVYNFFPRTPHIEHLAILTRK